MYKQLKAFTLLELLVAMAITGIVVSIAGLAFNMLSSQFHTYRKDNTAIASVFRLNSMLHADVLEAIRITRSENDLLLQCPSKPALHYVFDGDRVLRVEPEHTDTFMVAAGNIRTSLLHEDAPVGLVDELYFEAAISGQEEVFHFTKRYAAEVFMNKEEQDGN